MAKQKAISRRTFLNRALAGGGSLTLLNFWPAFHILTSKTRKRPNILLIISDQQGLDTFSSLNIPHVHTPNLDRLKARGTFFRQSYSVNPICSPARSSLFTGRMPSETGVIHNGLAIRSDLPNLGQWLAQNGFRTVYAGKWHLPNGYTTSIAGFEVLPAGLLLRGTVGDATVARACEGFLRNYASDRPFFMVASFLQPHDICSWIERHRRTLKTLPLQGIEDQLPGLPPNMDARPPEPEKARIARRPQWNALNWRYYLWSYYRMVEEVDREIGLLLDALQDTGLDENTLIIFTSDHGEGRGRHGSVLKNFLYEEAVKVPLVISFPAHLNENRISDRLVSTPDIAPTICDFAGLPAPPGSRGRSLKPLLLGKNFNDRGFVVAEVMRDQGRMIRNERFKLIAYRNDPQIQLFDLQNDPWETQNVAGEARFAAELKALKKELENWEKTLDLAPNALGPFRFGE